MSKVTLALGALLVYHVIARAIRFYNELKRVG
jgi:hypothetical protein